jgi:phage/plasmid-associated DNA primase
VNFLIEEYLDERFGQYKDFIKQWLAVFCYTNYKKLPHLILKGKRGTGKSTFSDIVSDIFPGLSTE